MNLSPDAQRAYQQCDWSELALRRHGWDGVRLQKTAHRICNDYVRGNIPYLAEHRRDELADFVTEKALEATMRFKPDHNTRSYGANGGRHFDSWIADIMWNRCIDWMRSKHEGNGDKRYGNDNRVVLSAMDDDPAPVDFEELVSDRELARHLERWELACTTVDLKLGQWVIITLNRAAKEILKPSSIAA